MEAGDPVGDGAAVGSRTPSAAGQGVVLAVNLALANVGFYVASIGVVLVVLAGDLGVPAQSLAWFGSTFGYGLFVVAVAGPWLLRLGPTRVLAGSAVLGAVGSGLLALSADPAPAYAGAILQGLGASGMVLVAPRLLRGPEAAARLTVANAAASVVGLCAPILLGVAATIGLGGRTPLLLMVAAMGVLAVAALRMRPTPIPSESSGTAAPTLARGTAARRWLVLVCSVSVEFCFVVWGVARLTATGLPTGMAAVVGAAFQIGMAVGRVAGAPLISRLPMVPIGAAVAAIGVVVVVATTSWPLVGIGQFIAGVGVAVMYPLSLARLMATPGLRPELGASLGALASATAITVAPAVLAGVALVVDLRLAFLAALPILAVLFWLQRERRPVATAGA